MDRAYDQEAGRRAALAIAILPARTPEGVCAKVRAVAAVDCWSVDALKDGGFAQRMSDAKDEEMGEPLLLSMILDVARLGEPMVPTAHGEAA